MPKTDYFSYDWNWDKPQQSKSRKKKVVEPPIATRNCYVGNVELVKGKPVRGLSENQIKTLKKRGLVK